MILGFKGLTTVLGCLLFTETTRVNFFPAPHQKKQKNRLIAGYHLGRNLVLKHKTIKFDVVGERPRYKVFANQLNKLKSGEKLYHLKSQLIFSEALHSEWHEPFDFSSGISRGFFYVNGKCRVICVLFFCLLCCSLIIYFQCCYYYNYCVQFYRICTKIRRNTGSKDREIHPASR